MMRNYILFFLVLSFISFTSLIAQESKEALKTKNIRYYQYDTDFLSPEFHRERRDSLRALMPKNSAAVFFAAPERKRSNDVYYQYHQNPNFYYLTGVREPNAMLIVYKELKDFEGDTVDEILLLQERDPSKEIWNGRRMGVEGAKVLTTFKKVIPNSEFVNFDPKFKDLERVFFQLPEAMEDGDTSKTDNLMGLVHHFQDKNPLKDKMEEKHLQMMMAQLREVKTEEELLLLRKAINITCKAQNELMQKISLEMSEYETAAIVEYVFKRNGAEYPGFPSIHGSGENSCILHYTSNRRPLSNGGLLVSDVGAEYRGYSADVTRTIPPSGKFSTEEALIYNLVLKAQQAGIDAAVVGNSFWAPHKAAQKVIANGLKDLGIIKSKIEVGKYFMHGTSHYLGLDVHDVGTYMPLQENNVITVEPGIYISEESDCDPKWWNIGVRIEDDILICKEGPENLSDKSPRTIEEIEKLMKK